MSDNPIEMSIRRRKKKPAEPDWDNLKRIGSCLVEVENQDGAKRPCGFYVYETEHGTVCRGPDGHGAAPYKTDEGHEISERIRIQTSGPARESREITERPPEGFEVRDGDRITVQYTGAKLSIKQYSNVEIDGSIYSRTLLPGDDAGDQWDRVYGFLKQKCEGRAREKLALYADELAKAQKRTRGE